jgi:hypothetical protein
MLIRKDYITFQIMGKTINLYSEDMAHNKSTVAEIDEVLYYLGNENANISTAIFAWEETNDKRLTNEELRQTLIDNQLLLPPAS